MAFIEDFATVKIQCHTYLPPGTILVSPDIWKSLRETYGEDGEEGGRDRAFCALSASQHSNLVSHPRGRHHDPNCRVSYRPTRLCVTLRLRWRAHGRELQDFLFEDVETFPMSAENFKEPAQVAFDNGHAIFNASKTRLIKKYADQYGDGFGVRTAIQNCTLFKVISSTRLAGRYVHFNKGANAMIEEEDGWTVDVPWIRAVHSR